LSAIKKILHPMSINAWPDDNTHVGAGNKTASEAHRGLTQVRKAS